MLEERPFLWYPVLGSLYDWGHKDEKYDFDSR